MIRSGDRIPTGTGPDRRRLTQEEAEAGGLPEPMTREEWGAMAATSRGYHDRLTWESVQRQSARRLEAAQRAKLPADRQASAIDAPTFRRYAQRNVTEPEVRDMIDAARHGLTLSQIAAEFGRSSRSVGHWLRASGITTRRARRTPKAAP